MAQIKISELELNTQMSNEDVLAGVDTSEQKTKKFKLETLKTFINKEQDEQITKNKNDISANATNIKTNAENISKNSENIEKNAQDIVENKENIADNTNRTKRIENTLYDSGEANGTSINIKDSTLAEFQEISVDGVCKQETTTGKNLIDINEVKVPISSYKLPHTLSAGTYTISCKKVNLEMGFRLSNTTDTSTNSVVARGTRVIGDRQYLTLTTTFEVNYINISCEGIEKLEEVMLEASDVPTDYEPYTNLLPAPSPSYPQPIEVIDKGYDVVSCAKNKLDMSKLIATITRNGVTLTNNGDGTFNVKGTATADITLNIVKDIPTNIIKSGEKYNLYSSQQYDASAFNLSLILNTDMGVKYYIANAVRNAEFNIVNIAELALYIPSGQTIDAENVKVALYKSDTVINEYEPYQESIAPINLKGEFVGKINETAKDQVRIAFNEEKGEYLSKLDKNIGRDVLNGSENIFYAVEQGDYYLFQVYNHNALQEKPLISNKLIYASNWGTSNNVEAIFNTYNYNGTIIQVKILSSRLNEVSIDGVKEYLSQNPIEYYYPLAEPYEVDLGIVEMPLSYSPETNVFTTSELEAIINAKYYRNFINTIQNLQVNEKALQQELIDIQNQLKALQVNVSNLSVLATNDEVESEVI